MSRAVKAIPVVKLPLASGAEVPPDYFVEVIDVGFVIQTEEYPLPPIDPETNKGGDYKWQEATALTDLTAAYEKLVAVSEGADSFGANPNIIAESKACMTKVLKEIKALQEKNESDMILAIEVVKKLAKKMKKGKKKG